MQHALHTGVLQAPLPCASLLLFIHQATARCTGLVETSNNLAAVKPSSSTDSEAKYTIIMSTRSSLTHAMEVQRARIAALSGLCGATVAQDKAYPGWAPNPASPVLQVPLPCLPAPTLAMPQQHTGFWWQAAADTHPFVHVVGQFTYDQCCKWNGACCLCM